MSIKVFAYGNIGNDAEKVTIGEKTYTKFSLAVKTGKDSTLWCNVLTTNEKIAQYLVKGAAVIVWGRPDAKAYKSKDGEAKVDNTIWASEINLVGGRPQEQQQHNNSSTVADDTDLPF